MSLRSVVVEVVATGEEPGSGMIHAIARDGRRDLKDERCNLDQVSGRLIEVDLPLAVSPSRLCGHCFESEILGARPDAP